MIPDKIYIRPMPNPSDGYVGIAWDKTIPKCETYIRKDALLEWLEYEKDWFEGTDIEPHYQKVIDKLNSM